MDEEGGPMALRTHEAKNGSELPERDEVLPGKRPDIANKWFSTNAFYLHGERRGRALRNLKVPLCTLETPVPDLNAPENPWYKDRSKETFLNLSMYLFKNATKVVS
jgi:hypothetical protein